MKTSLFSKSDKNTDWNSMENPLNKALEQFSYLGLERLTSQFIYFAKYSRENHRIIKERPLQDGKRITAEARDFPVILHKEAKELNFNGCGLFFASVPKKYELLFIPRNPVLYFIEMPKSIEERYEQEQWFISENLGVIRNTYVSRGHNGYKEYISLIFSDRLDYLLYDDYEEALSQLINKRLQKISDKLPLAHCEQRPETWIIAREGKAAKTMIEQLESFGCK
jgi:hypothetical protein